MLDLNYENEIFKNGYKLIGAIDEAGRGPLAGPVVAACVLISPDFKVSEKLKQINDSKKITEKKREELYNIINESFIGFNIGICNQNTIDKINILEASFLAMKKAISTLKQKPEYVMLDGKFKIPNFSLPQEPIILLISSGIL